MRKTRKQLPIRKKKQSISTEDTYLCNKIIQQLFIGFQIKLLQIVYVFTNSCLNMLTISNKNQSEILLFSIMLCNSY